MAGDASSRRFWRLRLPDGTTRVVMDYGAPFEGEIDDVRIRRVFAAARLPCAAIERVEPAAGALVLEDLGDTTLETEIGRRRDAGSPIEPLYAAAVDLAVRVALDGTAALAASDLRSGPALDPARFRYEMNFFVQHFVEGWIGESAGDRLLREVRDLAERAAAATVRRVLCHRDFHSRNLMVRSDGTLAMVDIQDARWGPDTYDLASLLRDAYVDLQPRIVDDGLAAYRSALFPTERADDLRRRFDLVALQRMVKALGTFGYQATKLHREHYLEGVPRTVGRILALRERVPGYPALYGVLATVREIGG